MELNKIQYKFPIKYAMVGAIGTLVNTAVLYGLTNYFGIYYLISSIIGIELSLLSNFILNDKWTFSGEKFQHSWKWRLIQYHFISMFGAILLIACEYLFTDKLHVYYVVSNIMGIMLVFILNFILNRYTTWKSIDNQ
jgi:dolichol-phosphate mannosyltransferase